MKIDSAINNFLEKYNHEAMESIDRISKDYGLVIKKVPFRVFNIQESFNKFDSWLKGYASYQIESVDSDSDQATFDEISESCDRYINNDEMFVETDVTYDKLPEFVKSYIEGINTLLATVDELNNSMMEADVDPVMVGNINEFVDKFMTRMDESFESTMDRILWASGYNSSKAIASRLNGRPEPKAMFL